MESQQVSQQQPTIQSPILPSSSKLLLISGGLILIVIVGTGAYFVGKQSVSTSNKVISSISPTTTKVVSTDWKTYSDKDGYSIKYPSDWLARNGLFTAPGLLSFDVGIYIRKKINDEVLNYSLEDYVNKSAGFETGPARVPLSIKKVVARSGMVGYKAEWVATAYSDNKKTYTTFFSLPNDKTSTLQIDGIDNGHIDIYNQMILTFAFTNIKQNN